jgi:hypothetical protein
MRLLTNHNEIIEMPVASAICGIRIEEVRLRRVDFVELMAGTPEQIKDWAENMMWRFQIDKNKNNVNRIREVDVVRDESGMFHHHDFPSWDEGVLQSEIDEWLKSNDGHFIMIAMDGDASDEISEAWLNSGDVDCSAWEPTCNEPGSFLLAIYDTEDGPVALFFAPNN